jgi:hypothetical protein
VDIIEKKVEKQVQFWSLIGPFLILLSVGVLLFKMSSHWYFPLSAVIGIPLCVRWKLKGMAAALSFLFALSIFAYRSVDLDQQYWHVGIALSMAFSLIVLTLALEEVEGLMGKIRRESQSRLDNFLHLDESLKASEALWSQEKEQLQIKLNLLTQENIKVMDEKQTFFKLAQLAKSESIQLHDQHQLLLEELIYKKQCIAELNEKLEETELTIQELVNSEHGQKIKHLTEQLDRLSNQITEHEQEKERLHIAIVRAQDQRHDYHETESRQRLLIQEQLLRLNELRNSLVEKENQAFLIQQKNEELQTCLSQEKEWGTTRHQDLLIQTHELREELKNHQIAFTQTAMATEQRFKEQAIQHQNELQHALDNLEQLKLDLSIFVEKEKQASALHQQNEELKARLSEVEAVDTAHQNELTAANERLNASQVEVKVLEAKLSQIHHEFELAQQSLLQTFEETKSTLHVRESQLHQIQENRSKLPSSEGNSRRIEGMYIQLREQFEEKTTTLEKTRHELFLAQEKLEELKRASEECNIFSISQSESLLQRDLSRLTSEFEQLEKDYKSETEELHAIISVLI